jgi:membrane fusion protein, heavy metal efflux system
MCRVHIFFRAAILTAMLAGCSRHGPDGTTGGQGGATAAPPASSKRAPVTRGVHVAPELVAAGRIHTTRVVRRRPTGAVRLPADVVASPEGAAEAGTLLAGRVARFEFREGDHVKRGQVLAWLDAPEAARAVADLIRARTRTETQSRKVARLEGLIASEAATQVALDDARLELDLARADLAAARTFLGSLGLPEPGPTSGSGAPALLAQLPVRSPVDGIVVERNAPLGAHVTPETRLFRLLSEGRVLIEARIADGANVVLLPSHLAHVQPRGGGVRCAARVLGVLPQVDAPTRSRRVRLAPEGACAGLVPGAQADVEVEVAAPASPDGGVDDVLVVPARAVLDMKTAMVVFVKGREPGAFDVRPIEPGLRIGDDLVIGAGVTEGDEVVVDGAILLKGELMRSELGGEE